MNTGQRTGSRNEEFGYYRSDLGMDGTFIGIDLDLGHDLVIEDLDETDTKAFMAMCPTAVGMASRRGQVSFGAHPAITANTRSGAHPVLANH
jgi:hypothetical protein